MGFYLGELSERPEEGPLRGKPEEIACDCWFTSSGRTIPRLIKVMDGEGTVHTIPVSRVLASGQKNYSGIPTVEHICQIEVGERLETVRLVFTKENCKWSMVAV